MPITILSPYSGKPVKVRDQDVGRAIRDEEGRIFYIVDGTDGGGHYSSMTRKGSEKDEQRYRKLVDGSAKVDRVAREHVLQAHDATGKKRSNPLGMVILLLIVLAVAAAAYVYFVRPDLVPGLKPDDTTDPADSPAQPEGGEPGEGNSLAPQSNSRAGSSAMTQSNPPNSLDDGGIDPAAFVELPTLEANPLDDVAVDDRQPSATRPRTDRHITVTSIGASQPDDSNDDEREPEPPTDPDAEPVAVPDWTPGDPTPDAPVEADPLADFRVMPSGLRYKVIERGTGEPAQAGRVVAVRYAVYAADGSALVDDDRHTFILAAGGSIRALDEGLAGVRAGAQRVLFVPKGHSTVGLLPGLETLPRDAFFIDVQLLSVRPGVTRVTEEGGIGNPAMPGDVLELDFTAYVEGQTEPFDSSEIRGQRLTMTLGAGDVIPGLDAGLAGIRSHEVRVLTIPPYLAYGERGIAGGLVPPDAVLTYRVRVRSLQRKLD